MSSSVSANSLFFPHDEKKDHLKALDGLRGIAVLLVLLSHASHAGLYFHQYLRFEFIGKVGVHLFFVLSAYLLDRQISLALLNHKASLGYWINYALRRFLRVYPLFFIALVVYYMASILGVESVISSWKDIVAHLLLIKGDLFFWSIPVEFKYYLISPLILWFCSRMLNWDGQKMMALFLVMIVAAVALQWTCHLSRISTFRYLPMFLCGTLVAVYDVAFMKKGGLQPMAKMVGAVGLAVLFLILLTTPFFFESLFGFRPKFHTSIYYLLYAVGWSSVLFAAKYGSGVLIKMLEFRPLRFIGSISFSLYLFHVLILELTVQMEIPQCTKIYMLFGLAIAFSCVTYLLVERPLSKLYFTSRKTQVQ